MNFLTIFMVPFCIFLVGLIGIMINRKNVLLIIVCVELILLSINFAFLLISFYLDDIFGQIFAIFILTVAAAETSIGLAIFVVYYRVWGSIAIEQIPALNG